MSHFTKCKTSVKDKTTLLKALDKLGWKYEQGDFTITQYGQSSKAEIKFSNALGLSLQEDGTWAMVGDPYHHNGELRKYYRQEKQFSQDLGSAYAVVEATQSLEEQNFFCIDNEKGVVGPDGKIRMTFQSNSY